MSDIKYAYLKGQTWLYRRNYPKDAAPVLGSRALKQSLKTGDVKTARARAAEVNARYEELVRKVRSGAEDVLGDAETHADGFSWGRASGSALASLRSTLEAGEPVAFPGKTRVPTVSELSRTYLDLRGRELRWGGFKSVRYSVGLFSSKFSDRRVTALTRDDGREFLGLTPTSPPPETSPPGPFFFVFLMPPESAPIEGIVGGSRSRSWALRVSYHPSHRLPNLEPMSRADHIRPESAPINAPDQKPPE